MENQRQPSGSYFGPKSHVSTRSKAVNGSTRRVPRFKSKRMNNIVKDMEKRKAYMLPNMGKMIFKSGVGAKDNAHMHSGNKLGGSDKKGKDGIIFSPKAKKLPQKDSRAGQSLDVFPLVKNGASKLKQSLSHISKNARQSPTASSKDGSKANSGLWKQSHFEDSRAGQSSNVFPLIKNGASKLKRLLSHISKNARQSPTASLQDGSKANLGLRKQSHSEDSRAGQSSDVFPLMKNGAKQSLSHISKNARQSPTTSSKDGSKANLGLRKQSHSGTSHPIDLELTAKSTHRARNVGLELIAKSADRARNVDASNSDDDTLGSKSIDRSNRALVQESNVRKDTKEISRGSNIPFASETLETVCKDKNCAIVSSKDVAQSEFTKTCLQKKDQPSGYVDKSNDVNSKRKKGEGKLTTRDNDDCTRVDNDSLPCGIIKRRRCMSSNEDGDEVGGCNNNNPTGVDSTIRLTPQEPLLKKQQCNYCSKPICEPAWKGIFKIDGKEYVSLAGHLSTKSCEKVWELSKSLPPVVELKHISRLVAWPNVWNASKPSSDTIGLYFLPENMRHDGKLDQLTNEVMENDFLLRAVINDEAEMLIFPSVLLSKRYQTFQAKYYLWAVFSPREDRSAGLAEPPNGTGHLAQATCFKPAN